MKTEGLVLIFIVIVLIFLGGYIYKEINEAKSGHIYDMVETDAYTSITTDSDGKISTVHHQATYAVLYDDGEKLGDAYMTRAMYNTYTIGDYYPRDK